MPALCTIAVPAGLGIEEALPVPVGLRVAAGAGRSGRRLWLDTFDRRLVAKGVELYIEASPPGGPRILLAGPEDVTGPAPVPPGFDTAGAVAPGSLPPALAEMVRPLAGPRVLLPLAEARVTERRLAVLDDEDKTVCRVVTSRLVGVDGDRTGLVLVAVEPLRGYERVAEEVGRVLAAVPGARLVAGAPLQAWLDTLGAGVAPGSTPAGRGLTPDTPAAEAVALLIGRLLATAEANLPGTLARYDTEFLHDMRVAVRRARTAVKLGQGTLDEDARARLAEELKWLGDATTPPRDMDVYLEAWPDMEAQVSEDLRPHLGPFRRLIEERTEQAHRDLREALGSPRMARLLETGRKLTAGGGAGDGARGGNRGGEAYGAFAARSLNDALERVSKRGKRAGPGAPDEAVHDLRKRAKELRYMLEFSEALLPPEPWAELVRDLKALQDTLGQFNDSAVQRAFVLAGAETLAAPPVWTLLGLGELLGSLARTGLRARRQVPERLAGLERWRSEGRLWDLLAAGKDRPPS